MEQSNLVRPQARVPVLPQRAAQRKGDGYSLEPPTPKTPPSTSTTQLSARKPQRPPIPPRSPPAIPTPRSPLATPTPRSPLATPSSTTTANLTVDIPPPSTPPPPIVPATQSSPQIAEVGSLSSSSSSYMSGGSLTDGSSSSGHGAAPKTPPGGASSPNDENFVTLDSLITRLFSVRESDVDAEFMETFVLSMNIFIEPEEFLGIVIDQLNDASMNLDDEEEQVVKRRVFKILTYWVRELWNDTISPKAVEIVENFASEYQLVDEADELMALVRATTAKGCRPLDIAVRAGGLLPAPLLVPAELHLGCDAAELPEVDLLSYSPIELARQLTVVESALFRRLGAWEFQGLRFSKKDTSLAPNVYELSTHFNRMSMWVARNIMGVRGMANNNWALRARVIEKAIELGRELCRLQNYNGLYEVIAACSSTAVTRLKRSWEGVSERHRAILKELDEILTPEKNYASIRRRLAVTKPPCIPFIGLYQTDMTFAEDGNKTEMEGFVNWYKCKLQANILSNLHRYQRDLYPIAPVPFLIHFFSEGLPVVTEDEIWNLSQTIEPRGSSSSSTNHKEGGGHQRQGSRVMSISAVASLPLSGLQSSPSSPTTSGTSGASSGSSSGNDGSYSARASIANKFQFKEYNAVAPGVRGFIRVPLNKSMKVSGVKQAILELCLLRGVGLGQEEFDAEVASGFAGLKLVVYSGKRPYSKVVANEFTLGEVDTDLKYIALCRDPRPVRVLVPRIRNGGLVDNDTAADDLEGHFGFEIHADYGADDGATGLLRAVAETVGIGEPMGIVHYHSLGGKLRWLNRNFSLREQGFVPKDVAIVICPQTHFVEASGRPLTKRNVYFFNKECKRKDGYLTKAKSSNISPTSLPKGIFVDPSSGSSSGGDSSSSVNLMGSSSSSSSSSSSGAVNPALLLSGGSVAGVGVPVEHKDKNKWVVAVDNMLFVFKTIETPTPTSVYLLDCYDVSLATVGKSAREAIVFREAADSPFAKQGGKRKPIAFTAATAAGGGEAGASVRTWFADILTRSKTNIRTRSFGMPLREIAKRDGALALPRFVRAWFDFAVANAADLRAAFAAPAPQALLDAFRAEAEAGRAPQPATEAEVIAYAQLGLLFLCDLPTPLIGDELQAEFMVGLATSAYSRMGAERLRGLLAKHMRRTEAATLFAFLTFFRIWAEHSGAGVGRAAEILARVIFRGVAAQTPKAVGFTEELLDNVLALDLLNRQVEVDSETRAKSAEGSRYGINAPREQTITSEVDVSVFYKEEREKLEFLVRNYDRIAASSDTLRIADGAASFGGSSSGGHSRTHSTSMGKGGSPMQSSPNTSPNQTLYNGSPRNGSPMSSPSSSLSYAGSGSLTNTASPRNVSPSSSTSSSLTLPGSGPGSMSSAAAVSQVQPTSIGSINPSLMSRSSRSKLSLFHKK